MTYKELVYKLAEMLTKANLVGVVIASLWVLSVSGFVSVGPVIIIMMLYRFLLPTLIFPSRVFSNFMIFFNYKEKYKLEKLMMCLSLSWINFALSMWFAFIFYFGIEKFSRANIIAGAIWGSCVAMSSLLLWVRQEKDNPVMVSIVENMQIAAVVISLYRIYSEGLSYWHVTAVSFLIMTLLSMIMILFEKKLSVKKSYDAEVVTESSQKQE